MSNDKAGLPANQSAAEKAKAYWSQNEQNVVDICKFEGLKGVVYELFRYIIGAPVDFNEDVVLPAHKISEGRNSFPVRVSFDAAEGDGRVWFMDTDDNWVAIEGRENARTAARLLNAWADSYKEPAQ